MGREVSLTMWLLNSMNAVCFWQHYPILLFTGLHLSLIWSSLFDPRFASCEHMIGLEKQNALHLEREEIELIYFAQEPFTVAHGINEVINSESEECSSNSDDDQFTHGLGLNKASKEELLLMHWILHSQSKPERERN
jgi:hypothetical protein